MPLDEANNSPPAYEGEINKSVEGAGLVGAGVLLAALLGALLWIGIFISPVRLATGLLDARDHLSNAQSRLSRGQVGAARFDILAGSAAARRASAGLDSGPFMDIAPSIPRVGPVIEQTDHLVSAAELSASAARGTIQLLDTSLSGPDGIIAKDSGDLGGLIRIDRVRELATTVDAVRTATQEAGRELAAVDLSEFPARLRRSVVRGIEDADRTDSLLGDAQRGLALLPSILGADGPRTYLIGMLNYAELRGSGGSLLQYALLTIDNGEMELDGPQTVYTIDRNRVQLTIPLPEDAWYVSGIPDARRFGNANWSPDWPLSAQLTIDYAREREPTLPEIDGFIAVTPSVLKNLVATTGSFTTKRGDRITRETAIPLLVHDAYGKYPKPAVRRIALKQVVSGFFNRVLRPQNPFRLVRGLSRGLADKDLQIWMAAGPEQSFIKGMEWDGAIKTAQNKDYLSVVQQNVGGNKLDYFAEQTTDISVSFDDADVLVSTEVEIYNGVSLPQASWAMGNSGPLHRPMINVYVPGGAQLESASVVPESCPMCATYLVGNKATGKAPAPPLGRIDSPEPAQWIGDRPPEHIELGKKVWPATLQIPAQESASFRLQYRTPGIVKSVGERRIYRLVLQHQPKVRPDQVRLRIMLPAGATGIQTESVLPFSRDGNQLVWEHPLERDVELEVSWRQ